MIWEAGWALDDRTMSILLSEISDETRFVFEAGSGKSTVEIAKRLKPHGGRLIALEEEERFASKTRTALEAEGLDASCVHVSSLGPTVAGIWYRKLPKIEPGSINLVLIDGPRSDGLDERSASLFVLEDSLAPNCTIVVDDTFRPADRKAVEIWKRMGWIVEDVATERGCSILRRREA